MSNIDNTTIKITNETGIYTITEALLESFCNDEICDFVKIIDNEVNDVDFTKNLYEYFQQEVGCTQNERTEYGLDLNTAMAIIKAIIAVSNNNPAIIDGLKNFVTNIELNNE